MRAAEFFLNVLSLSDPEVLRQILPVTKLRHLEKDELLVRAGEIQTEISFLSKGILRGFLLDAEGHDVTDCFAVTPGAAAMATVSLDRPSVTNIEALTEAEVISFPTEIAMRLMEENADLVRVHNRLLQSALDFHWQLKTVLCQYDAMGRYQWFLRSFPGLIDQVSNKHIASLLGMTPVTLSRLRSTLRQEKAAGRSAPQDGRPVGQSI